jgi:hypothetical protein
MRHYDPATGNTEWQLRGELKGAKDLVDKTRANGLFLSRAAEMNLDSVAELYLWFRDRFSFLGLAALPRALMQQTACHAAGDSSFRGRVERLIRDADFAIHGLVLGDQLEFDFFDEGLRRETKAVVAVGTLHGIPDSEETVRFRLEADESNGTQRFFALVGPVLEALDEGRLLVVDELDCSMHPQLTYKLVEMFHSPEANPKGAQLVFATHDTSLMTPALFRRDQIWLTEKTRKGAAVLFSLCEIQPEKRPRKDEPFEKHYLAGRYGGVPNFGPALEDFERL